MKRLYKNKYRVDTFRWVNWNYAWCADYFITVLTYDKQCFFGEITDKKAQLSKIGEIVKNEWEKTFEMRPDMNLTMGEYVIMPNHIHAIIRIGKNEFNSQNSLNDINVKSKFGPQSKNIGSIMRGFKSSVTMKARLINSNFKWKTRFHDHVIRNNWAFYNIEKYIIENPEKWKEE
ncbi:hypothetical protein ERX46_02225 [Brumimicrobium glaciale]|uniref:Transposase IS200-like domain-containing protein n=1 Tax=Brumimicrobium glaciale TaxID=200475 RepID=A0A4Q4KRD2_9FLAO|nr:transposase [Brumimicrobium glaciale]RYM35833.1 hypothetical protein ERX46_02225 [Brumimicrobium glaciale]